MKKEWIITFRSVTFAQKGERTLRRGGLDCRLARTPKHLSERGCGYCLRIWTEDVSRSVELLRKNRVNMRRVYIQKGDGQLEAVEL